MDPMRSSLRPKQPLDSPFLLMPLNLRVLGYSLSNLVHAALDRVSARRSLRSRARVLGSMCLSPLSPEAKYSASSSPNNARSDYKIKRQNTRS